jgi:hypothetical protein
MSSANNLILYHIEFHQSLKSPGILHWRENYCWSLAFTHTYTRFIFGIGL